MRNRAVGVLGLTLSLDVIFGIAYAFASHVSIWNGLYFATSTATTVGYGDITPHGWLPHLLSVCIMLSVVPLFSAFFSLLTVSLTTAHLKKHIDLRHIEMKRHVTEKTKSDG